MNPQLQDVIATARPERTPSGFAWWPSNQPQAALETRLAAKSGHLPREIYAKLKGTVQPPPGRGGVWFATEQEALEALRSAV
jgi:hypothetical protein